MKIKVLLTIAAAMVPLALLMVLHPWSTRRTSIDTGYVMAKDLPQVKTSTAPRNTGENTIWNSPIDGRAMTWIAPGGFIMGSPELERRARDSEDSGLWRDTMGEDENQHTVRIERGFWLDRTEVTNEAYLRFVLENPQ